MLEGQKCREELGEFCNGWTVVTLYIVGGVAQLLERRSWPANFPCPALDLQLMDEHKCG